MSAAINSNQLGPEASWPVSGAGRALGIHPSFLFDHLRRHGWLIRRPGDTGDCAAAEAIASGDMTNFPVLVARHAGKPFSGFSRGSRRRASSRYGASRARSLLELRPVSSRTAATYE